MVFVLSVEDDQKHVAYETQHSLLYHHKNSAKEKHTTQYMHINYQLYNETNVHRNQKDPHYVKARQRIIVRNLTFAYPYAYAKSMFPNQMVTKAQLYIRPRINYIIWSKKQKRK